MIVFCLIDAKTHRLLDWTLDKWRANRWKLQEGCKKVCPVDVSIDWDMDTVHLVDKLREQGDIDAKINPYDLVEMSDSCTKSITTP